MQNPTSNSRAAVCMPPVWHILKGPCVFLAGSIEMGDATHWQPRFCEELSHLPITILNPRRDDWDRTWKQDKSNAEFKNQVNWEMRHLNKSDVIALYLEPGTMSPISLLELGLLARERKLVICCPEGFWKRGNVQMVCEDYDIPLLETLEELKEEVEKRLEKLIKERQYA